MDTLIAFIVAAALTLFFLRNYFKRLKDRDAKARAAAEKGKAVFRGAQGAASAHRHHLLHRMCDLHDRLSRGRRARHARRQSGHRERLQVHRAQPMCRRVPGRRDHDGDGEPQHGRGHAHSYAARIETTVPNMFIVGELGGLALIKNAVNQGRDCVDTHPQSLHGAWNAPAPCPMSTTF